jgi:hypothetical protein
MLRASFCGSNSIIAGSGKIRHCRSYASEKVRQCHTAWKPPIASRSRSAGRVDDRRRGPISRSGRAGGRGRCRCVSMIAPTREPERAATATVGTIAVTRELERRRLQSRPRSPRGSSPPHRQGASGCGAARGCRAHKSRSGCAAGGSYPATPRRCPCCMKRSATGTDDTSGGPSRTEAGRAGNKAMRARTAGFRRLPPFPRSSKRTGIRPRCRLSPTPSATPARAPKQSLNLDRARIARTTVSAG